MTLILVVFLVGIFAFGAFCLRACYLLARGRFPSFFKMHRGRGVSEEKIGPLGRSYAVLFFLAGVWLVVLPICIVLYRIPFSSWAGLIMVSTGLFFVGGRIIHRIHGIAAP